MTAVSLRWPTFWLVSGLALCGLIFALALVPVQVVAPAWFADKVQHAAAFIVLTVWFSALVRPRRIVLLAATLLSFGIAIELAQLAVGYRSAELADLVADAIGIALGTGLALAGLRHWAQWMEALARAILPR